MPVGVVIGLVSAVLTALVTEVYCHRCLAHHAFRVHRSFERFLDAYVRVIVWTDPHVWAAVHRMHHRYADTPRDPHSPVLRPPAAVLLGSPFLFATARKQLPPGRPAGPRIWALRAAVPACYLVLFGPGQVLLMAAVHLVFYLGIMGMVNTVGHLYGSKPHPDVPGYDAAWLAIPLLGHGYHNSHHAHPAAARTGPLDPIWPLLRAGAGLGLIDLDGRRAGPAVRACCGASACWASAPAPAPADLTRRSSG